MPFLLILNIKSIMSLIEIYVVTHVNERNSTMHLCSISQFDIKPPTNDKWTHVIDVENFLNKNPSNIFKFQKRGDK